MSHTHEHVADASGAPADAFTREATYAATRRPVDLAQTLTPEAYTSEAFFAVERERVFATSWVAVGCSAQLREPGDVLVTEVAGRSDLRRAQSGPAAAGVLQRLPPPGHAAPDTG